MVCEDVFSFKGGIAISVMVYVSGLLGDRAFKNLHIVCSVQA